MERRYIAFISYRHLPLDMATAKKLHKRIEHYLIPKDLRKEERKKPGYVFRDMDELPISSDLNANIEQALDHSEFLIVICTPETLKSKWVLGEVSYFLQHHPRERVLAVLADGTPDTSFPPQLTVKHTPEGDIPNQIEPLAANIVADNPVKRARLFRTESLRILAALIGCPYDALYRREMRYQRRRILAAAAVVMTVAGIFIGMLLNRNSEIRAQLRKTQINESLAFSSLSEKAYEEGDYRAALSFALKALPREKERPYVAQAEAALSKALNPYINGKLSYIQCIHQETDTVAAALSEDGEKLAALDAAGTVHIYRCVTGEELWATKTDRATGLVWLDQFPVVLVTGFGGTAAFDADSGALLWENKDILSPDLPALAKERKIALKTAYFSPEALDGETFSLLDTRTGESLKSFRLADTPARLCVAAALSDDQEWSALLLQRNGEDLADLLLCSLKNGSVSTVMTDLHASLWSTAYRLAFTQQGDLALVCDDMEEESVFRLFSRKDDWKLSVETLLETEKIAQVVNHTLTSNPSVDVFTCWDQLAVVGSKHMLHMISLETGELCWSKALRGTILSAVSYGNSCLALSLSDGTITFCTDTGVLTYTQGIYSFEGGFPAFLAGGSGESYPESTFLFVPDEERSVIDVICFRYPEWMIPVAAFSGDVSHMSLFSSPDGRMTACVGYNAIDVPVEWVLLDTVEGSSSGIRSVPENSGWENPAVLQLSNDGKLTGTGDVSSAGKATMIRRNGEELLISLDEDGTVSVLCTADGTLLYSAKHAGLTIQIMEGNTRVYAAESKDSSRLLLFFDSLSIQEPRCIVLETESWNCCGAYNGPAAYISERDSVLVTSLLDGVYLSPFWSCSEMMDMARNVVGS